MKKLRVKVNGVSYDVEVEILEDDDSVPSFGLPTTTSYSPPNIKPTEKVSLTPPAKSQNKKPSGAIDPKVVTSPIAGTVIEVKVNVGDEVKLEEPLVVLETMKMHTNINSPADGKIKEILLKVDDMIKPNQPLITFE